ncbi:MAG: ABC transporter ATP-binding protein [Phycisphaerae bacterium]
MPKQTVPVVQTAGLCKTFNDFWRRPRVEAVKDLDLEIRPGEVFGLLGPNGSGKTTTIKMLLGLLYPTRGRISVFGRAPTDVSVKSRIGFLPEESYLYRFLVAHETMDFYGRLFRLPARVRRERTERLLDMVGLHHEARRRVGEYSKGMARRIGLAQALINDPELLILDEPTSGLDPVGARQIKDVIRELGRKAKTILLSSHVLSDVEDVCDRVVILYGGQQRAAGSIGDLLQEREVTQITSPSLSPETIERLRELIRQLEDKEVLQVAHPRQRLEDFFLRIVEEAQAARISTSGATGGGAIPDFLTKPTETTTQEVVQALVSAALSRPEPLEGPASTAEPAEAHPSKELLDQLLGVSASEDEETVDTEQQVAPPAPSQPTQVRPPVHADESVIDSLLRRNDDDPSDRSKTAS